MTSRYELAKKVLTEVEKDRLLACYLNCTDKNAAINWQKASEDYGSASMDSFKKMVANAFKKVDAAELKAANGEEPTPAKVTPAKGGPKRKAAGEADDEETEETPKPKAKRGRKAAVKVEAGDEAEGVETEETPKPKAKRGRPAKKAAADTEDAEKAEEEIVVKAEDSDKE